MSFIGKIKNIFKPNTVKNNKVDKKLEELNSYVATPRERSLKQPVFVLTSIRSGSTLLSSVLNAHSNIFSPHETHFTKWRVPLARVVKFSLRELDLNQKEIEYQLWDRVLSGELEKEKKEILIEKTPNNVFSLQRILECWPNAKFIILKRHPVSVARSWKDRKPDFTDDKVHSDVLKYMNAIQNATQDRALKGKIATVRYEDLTSNPEKEMRKLCDFLGVKFEKSMLDYNAKVNVEERYRAGRGDWSDNIRSGKIQKGKPLPKDSEIPEKLRPICEAWGYLEN